MAYELPAQGITGIKKVADHLADFGRFGDGHLVHASEGEAVVPSAVLNENPNLKTALFTQMREKGLDPNRYIVGDELNSINPVTGQPEFGAVRDFFKGIKNVVKAIAPVVLPVALSMTKLGPIFGSAAGTGIASLIGGASLGRSLKNSVIAGGIGGLYAGLQGARAGGGWEGFKSGVGKALGQPFAARVPRTPAPIEERTFGESELSPIDVNEYLTPGELRVASGTNPITAAEASLPLGQLQPLGNFPSDGSDFQLQARSPLFGQTTPQRGVFSTDPPAPLLSSRYSGANIPSTRYTGGISARGPEMGQRLPFEPRVPRSDYLTPGRTIISGGTSGSPSYTDPNTGVTTYGIASDPIRAEVALGTPYSGEAFTNRNALGLRGMELKPPSFRSQAAPIVDRSKTLPPQGPQAVGGTSQGVQGDSGRGRFAKARDYLVRGGKNPKQVEEIKQAAFDKALLRTGDVNIADEAYNAAGPNMLEKWGPSTALGLGAAGLFGAFKPGEEPEPVDFYAQMGGTSTDRLRDNPGLFRVGVPTRAYTPATLEDIRYSAVGGPINQDNFPRRIGAINGAGTGTSDDVRAMLSDGEYVMTAKAVRGAGNGNRKQGMHNMYNMMRQFEGQAV
jgi:hypothetical protein|tara:strand:+ start:128 stop:1987 length:1860 start_codon:yes stop_codon:yes gene_type:complete